jgi:putative oxidoreductase
MAVIANTARRVATVHSTLSSVGLLVLRVAFGGMMLFGHGWGKLTSFADGAEKFADPLGIGPTASMAGAVFSEVVCAGLVMVGLVTRVACVPLVFTFVVAAFLVHGKDPFFMAGGAAKEPALLYLCAFLALLFTGPGRFSIDDVIHRRVRTKPAA